MKLAFAMVLLAALMWSMNAAAQPQSKTLQNLQAAYNGESNARAKYLDFAKHADSEGYGKVASLFRAASKAEEIHLNCEAAAIKAMGATPQADIKASPVKSTKENLQNSENKGEAYERDTMYPKFIRQAARDKNNAAAQCFRYARAAEAEHFKLFTDAARNLEKMKGAATYYVCSEGGYTMAKLNSAKCPGAKYEEVK